MLREIRASVTTKRKQKKSNLFFLKWTTMKSRRKGHPHESFAAIPDGRPVREPRDDVASPRRTVPAATLAVACYPAYPHHPLRTSETPTVDGTRPKAEAPSRRAVAATRLQSPPRCPRATLRQWTAEAEGALMAFRPSRTIQGCPGALLLLLLLLAWGTDGPTTTA